MSLLAQLWLPILLSAVFVFFCSALFNMLLRFWHMADYQGFTNEEDVRAAVRGGSAGRPGLYTLPYCTPENMKDPAFQAKFTEGPVAMVMIRPAGPMSMGKPLLQWFLFCLLVSFLCALLAVHVIGPGADHKLVFHVLALAALLGHAAGSIPNAIWWAHPWKAALKYMVDGIVYAVIVGLTFAWLWPAAA